MSEDDDEEKMSGSRMGEEAIVEIAGETSTILLSHQKMPDLLHSRQKQASDEIL